MKRNFVFGAAMLAAPVILGGCVVAASSSSGNDGGGGSFLFLILPFVALMGIAALLRRRRAGRSSISAAQPPSSVQMLRAELSVLADDVLRLEPHVALKDEARDDFESAAHRYRVAQAALDQGGDKVDLTRVQRVVDEGAWSMSRVRALLDGREPPPPPPVLQRPGHRGEPAVGLDGGAHPTYVDSQAPFRSGWFSTGAGVFGGLLLGPMLGFGVWGDADGNQGFGDDPGE